MVMHVHVFFFFFFFFFFFEHTVVFSLVYDIWNNRDLFLPMDPEELEPGRSSEARALLVDSAASAVW